MLSERGKGRVALFLLTTMLLGGALACQVGKGAAPTVEITFPPTGRQVEVGAVIPIHSVSRDDRGLGQVELWSGGQLVETTPASGTMYAAVQQWTAQQVGVINLGVRAVDSEGQPSEPAVISIQVVGSSAEITDPLPSAPPAATETPGGGAQAAPSAEPGQPVDFEMTNLTLSNVNPSPGEAIVVGVTILNRGGTVAEDFQWAWNPGTGEDPLHSEAVPSLAPGDDVVMEMRYTYQQLGQYSAQAWADSQDAYEEPDETNNFAYEDVNVGGAAQDTAAATVWFHDYQEGGWATFGAENTGTMGLECVHVVVNCGEGVFALHTEAQQPQPFLGGWSGRPPGDESLAPGQGAAMAVNIGEMEGPIQCDAEFTFYTQNGGQGMSTGAIPVQFSVEDGGGAQAQEIRAQVSFHDYQGDGWATFSVTNGGTVALESMAARISCGEAPILLHTEDQQNQPFLGGWSGRPPEDESLAPGQGAAVAVEIGQLVGSVPCDAQFRFYSEDGGGGLATGTINVEFVVE